VLPDVPPLVVTECGGGEARGVILVAGPCTSSCGSAEYLLRDDVIETGSRVYCTCAFTSQRLRDLAQTTLIFGTSE